MGILPQNLTCIINGSLEYTDDDVPEADPLPYGTDFSVGGSLIMSLYGLIPFELWMHWTTKMLVVYVLPNVCLRLRQLSQLSFIDIWGCVCSVSQFSCDGRKNVCTYLIIIIKSEVWFINHCLGLGHQTMICAVCLTMFYGWIAQMT